MEEYEADLIKMFNDAEDIIKQAITTLKEVYSKNGLEWSKGTIKGLKGDIYA